MTMFTIVDEGILYDLQAGRQAVGERETRDAPRLSKRAHAHVEVVRCAVPSGGPAEAVDAIKVETVWCAEVPRAGAMRRGGAVPRGSDAAKWRPHRSRLEVLVPSPPKLRRDARNGGSSPAEAIAALRTRRTCPGIGPHRTPGPGRRSARQRQRGAPGAIIVRRAAHARSSRAPRSAVAACGAGAIDRLRCTSRAAVAPRRTLSASARVGSAGQGAASTHRGKAGGARARLRRARATHGTSSNGRHDAAPPRASTRGSRWTGGAVPWGARARHSLRAAARATEARAARYARARRPRAARR